MSEPPASDLPFDRALRRLRRDRAARAGGEAFYLHRRAADELLDRLDGSLPAGADALDLGTGTGHVARELRSRGLHVVAADAGTRFARAAGGVQCDEDRLPFADASFDLVVSVGVLDTVNDLPGALALVRRLLRPSGRFLAALIGGPLPALRRALRAAEAASGEPASPRVHPRVDVRGGGDLLLRAGFRMPVADQEEVTVRFPSFQALVADLRGMGLTNLMRERSHLPLARAARANALADFEGAAGPDGKTEERFEIVYLSGWAPSA